MSFVNSPNDLRTTSSAITTNAPRILVIGAAYGGLSTIMNILNLCDGKPQFQSPIPMKQVPVPQKTPLITLLDERDGIFHTMGAPLAHTSKAFAPTAWQTFSSVGPLNRPNVRILNGRATGIDLAAKMATYSTGKTEECVEYDYLVVSTGSKRSWPIVPKALDKVSYLKDAETHINSLENASSVVVIGGGAVGIEVASELKILFPSKTITLVHSREQLLSSEPLPDEFKQKALSLLQDSGVEVVLNARVLSDEETGDGFKVVLSTGTELTADKVIYAISKQGPQTNFLPNEVLTVDGYVKVNATMSFSAPIPNARSHFAVGDIAFWPGIKRVGSAIIMGQFAASNIVAMIAAGEQGRSEKETVSQDMPRVEPMMALAVGNRQAVGWQGGMGLFWGEELWRGQFGEDMGFAVVLGHLGLTVSSEEKK
ncbi:FAD/NAD(P)-binding domain-containing protein [Morchella conica CCBAS932]|uniref:FAD/NAD(P)-binding domain-containing protein n=1 Tax=Morchella conica CCBAS932 TaxID=1392247 RepID=A0A3N4KH43_9PEZI|nr:FAD/NAD(P)-binding domain-containing protein [Morchella conica CCBAS932]